MVYVSVSETYDLSTQTNKMSLIGIHTPKRELIEKTYPGLCMNSKYCRIVSQDVVIACASMEPADPLQIGTTEGSIAPEDMFNPILYKAVSNDAMSQIEARLHGLGWNETATVEGNQAVVDNDEVTPYADEFPVYYSLLSNRDGFRAANPQQGLQMTGLKPLVFEVLSNVGVSGVTGFNHDYYPVEMPKSGSPSEMGVASKGVEYMRGNAKPMPRFPTSYITGASPTSTAVAGSTFQYNGMGDGQPVNEQIHMPKVLPVFTACIIVPPSRLHKLFYRMVVRTHLEFTEIRPMSEVTGFYGLSLLASDVYYSDYEDISKRFASTRETQVDVANAEIKKIMEGA